jgi:hypothetical protein
VEVERLGPTLMNVHVRVLGAEMAQNYKPRRYFGG